MLFELALLQSDVILGPISRLTFASAFASSSSPSSSSFSSFTFFFCCIFFFFRLFKVGKRADFDADHDACVFTSPANCAFADLKMIEDCKDPIPKKTTPKTMPPPPRGTLSPSAPRDPRSRPRTVTLAV